MIFWIRVLKNYSVYNFSNFNMLILYAYQPQSKSGVDSFGGLGATLIDSLDTLYIMGLNEEFQRARE